MNRDRIFDLIFGENLTGDEAAKKLAARPPQSVFALLLLTRLAILALLLTSLFGVKDRVPLIGPWLAGSWWHLYAAWAALLSIPFGVEWLYERRANRRPG